MPRALARICQTEWNMYRKFTTISEEGNERSPGFFVHGAVAPKLHTLVYLSVDIREALFPGRTSLSLSPLSLSRSWTLLQLLECVP